MENRFEIKTSILLTIGLLFGLLAFGQDHGNKLLIHDLIQKQTDEIFDSLVNIRRDLHIHPELSEHEQRTSNFIEKYLLSLELEVKTNIGGYGVVGILEGAKTGKKIAWRADIDALKSDFPDIVDFKSKNEGVRHICGHDVHTTIGLGIAKVLASQKENIKGTIYFIFQPSEENYRGAKSMIDDGLFDMIKPDEIYGLHINPMPVGIIAAKSNEVYAYLKVLQIKYKKQANDNEKVEYTKSILTELMNVRPDSKFWNYQNFGDPEIGLASPNGIYKNYLLVNQDFKVTENDNYITIETVLTGSNKNELDLIPNQIKERILKSDFKENLISTEYTIEYPTVINNPNLTERALNSISVVYGKQSTAMIYGVIPDFNDDFSFYQKKVPGVYFFLGGSNYQKGQISMPHTPNFAVDEECIRTGVNYFSSMIVERLGNE
jgi:metal-dependent amidase/aminoacylase/carboxypeptidase family protein